MCDVWSVKEYYFKLGNFKIQNPKTTKFKRMSKTKYYKGQDLFEI